MPFWAGADIVPTSKHRGKFVAPNPIGIVLHRTQTDFHKAMRTSLEEKSAHFLIGKTPGSFVQFVDTDLIAYHVKHANEFYIGIEFESIKGEGKVSNPDPLTPFQLDRGREVIKWICQIHNIPTRGPPSHVEMQACHGRYRGLMSHADLSGFGTNHDDYIRLHDWTALLPITSLPGDFPKPGGTRA
jgi:N-acetyl-anhydromuramyl-L-alanine amidase AmpD